MIAQTSILKQKKLMVLGIMENPKKNRPPPIVGMGLFMDYDGIPLAFDIYPGNQNEQPTLKPIEKRVLKDYGINNIVICTDTGLSQEICI